MGLPVLATWRVETLRLTVFFGSPVNANGLGWWKRITGEEPESAINRPQAGEYSEVGQYLDGQFEMKVAFNRADWVLSYPFSSMPGAPNPAEISQLSNSLFKSFSSLLSETKDPIIRVAYGVVAFHSIESSRQGNDIIGSILPFVKFDSEVESNDLMIQINNPCDSAVRKGLLINRISKLGNMTRQTVEVGPSGIPSVVTDQVLRAEFDISTAVDNTKPLGAELLAPLSIEMKDIAEALLTYGVRA